MKKILIAISALLLVTFGANAQSYTTISYSMGFGSGDLGDFISTPSFRGMTLDYHKLVQPNIGVGVSFGWNTFYEALDRDTYTVDNVSLTAKQWRYSNNFPMLASVNYYLSQGERFNPYVGMGIGTIYTLRNTDFNLYTIEQDAWNFALQPSIGTIYKVNDTTKFHVSLRYNLGFQAGSELTEAQNYFNLNVGFVFGNAPE
jgi:opacity protein-like surface antigen